VLVSAGGSLSQPVPGKTGARHRQCWQNTRISTNKTTGDWLMAEIELYSFSGCPFAQRSHMVLLEKQLEFTLTEIDLRNKPDGWETISPYGKVPVLRHRGQAIYESGIINEYIDEVFDNPPLLPKAPFPRAVARIWIDYCDSRFLPACRAVTAHRDDEKRSEAVSKLSDTMRFMEYTGLRKLSAGPYWLGNAVSLVDFHYLPFFERFECYEELGGAQWPEDCTRLRRWFDTMAENGSFLATRKPASFHLEQHRRRLAAAG